MRTVAVALALVKIGTFSAPVYVTAPAGDAHRVFVVQQGGVIRVVEDGTTLPTPFLSLGPTVVKSGGEQGLLGLAFAPDYATSGLFYLYYTAPAADGSTAGSDLVVAEGRRSAGDPDVADPGLREVVRIPHRGAGNHNGGQIAFGPDGLLYLATGDGGGGGDTFHNGQTTTGQLAKMLRLDPRSGSAPELYAYGLRNPYRWSFDRETGDLIIGDVGQSAREEVDFLPAGTAPGSNFGWNHFEGDILYPGGEPLDLTGPYVAPVLTHTHTDHWCAIVGGYVVRDPNLPDLVGRYVYGDNCLGKIYVATLGASGATGDADSGLAVPSISGFGEDGCGRVYVASLSGPVYRLSEGGECAPPSPEPPAPPAGGAGPAPVADPGPSPPEAAAPPPAVTPDGVPQAPRLTLRGLLVHRARAPHTLRIRAACSPACALRVFSPDAVRAVARSIAQDRVVVLSLHVYGVARRRIGRALRRTGAARVPLSVTVTGADGVVRRVVAAIRIVGI